MRTAIITAFSLALAGPALAQPEEPVPGLDQPPAAAPEVVMPERRQPALELSLKAGGRFPQITNDLGTNFDAIIKIGYGVALERQVQAFLEIGYTQPTNTHEGNDPRLGAMGSRYSSELTVKDLSTVLGGTYFFRPMTSFWLPYAGAGLQLHFLKSEVVGPSPAFGENTETSTQVGGVLFGGTGVHVGPGVLLGELRFGFAPVSQRVTGSSNIGAVSVLLGYGLLL